MVIERRQEIASTNTPLRNIFTACVRRTDHLPARNTTACEQYGSSTRPVVSTRLHHTCLRRRCTLAGTRCVRDFRSSTKFARHDDHHFLVEAASKDVLDQCRHGLVEE